MTDPNENPLSYQVGGSHYKGLGYQPIEFFADIHLDFFKANIIKYLSRWRKKNGVEDLEKARHYAQLAHNKRCEELAKCKKFMDQFSKEDKILMWYAFFENYDVLIQSLNIKIACGGYEEYMSDTEPVLSVERTVEEESWNKNCSK